MKWGPIAAGAVLGAGACMVACSGAEKLQGKGGACLTADDCQMGLVCLLDAGVCSNDLTSLVHTEEAGPKADAPVGDVVTDTPAGDAPLDDGATPVPEGAPPVADAGEPPDAGTASTEAAAPPPPKDAGGD